MEKENPKVILHKWPDEKKVMLWLDIFQTNAILKVSFMAKIGRVR